MKLTWKTCLRVGVSIFLLYLCIHYWGSAAGILGKLLGAAAPLLIGCIVAYVLNILMSFYERHYLPKSTNRFAVKSRRVVCLLLAIVTLLLIVALVVGLVLPQLVSCVQLIVAETPGFLREVSLLIQEWGFLPEDITDTLANIDWRTQLSQILQVVGTGLGSVVDVLVTTVTSVFSGIVTAFLAFIFAIYLLLSKERLSRQFHRVAGHYLKASWYRKLTYFVDVLNDCFHKYIVGQCTEAVILGVLCALGMWILRLPYAAMIGALIAFTALVPIAGAYIGAVVGAFMILTVSPIKAVIFVVFLVILQQLEGNIIYPRVVGSSIGLPGIWVLAAVTVGGGVMGIGGMLLGVPLAAAIYRLVRDDVNRGREKNLIPPEVVAETEENAAETEN